MNPNNREHKKYVNYTPQLEYDNVLIVEASVGGEKWQTIYSQVLKKKKN